VLAVKLQQLLQKKLVHVGLLITILKSARKPTIIQCFYEPAPWTDYNYGRNHALVKQFSGLTCFIYMHFFSVRW